MATKYVEVKTVGPVEWAKLHESNRDMEGYKGAYIECEGMYTVNQVLDREQYEKLKNAGTLKRPKNNDRLLNGEFVLKFERKHLVVTKDGRVLEKAGGAPKVTDSDGQLWDLDIYGGIGNGSIAEITNLLTFFDLKEGGQGVRTTLQSVKILEHVPIPDRDEEAA